MATRPLTTGFFFVALGIACVAFAGSPLSLAGEQEKTKSDKKTVTLTLRISDNSSGLTLEAKKVIPNSSNGFDVLRDTVTVKYKTFPKLGPFVTGLCGVEPPPGFFWALYVDSKLSDVGIGAITVDKDTLIEWKTQKADK